MTSKGMGGGPSSLYSASEMRTKIIVLPLCPLGQLNFINATHENTAEHGLVLNSHIQNYKTVNLLEETGSFLKVKPALPCG